MLGNRQALSGDQRLVNLAGTFDHKAVHGNALARANDDKVTFHDVAQRDLTLNILTAYACHVRAQRIQCPDGLRRLVLGAKFKPFPQQDERDDHGRGFEIGMYCCVAHVGEQQIDTQSVGSGSAQRDQQVHVSRARLQGVPAGAIEARPQPELNRSSQSQLQPAGQRPVQSHERCDHGHGQWKGQCCGQRHAPPITVAP